MSNHLISTAYKRQLGSLLRKSVMVLMADKASDDGGGIYASKQTMAAELDCTKQSIIKTVQQFIDEGILSEVGRKPSATGYTVEYAIAVDALEALPFNAAEVRKQDRKGSTPLTGQPALPVNDVNGRGQPGLPKPSKNQPTKASPSSVSARERARPCPDGFEPSPAEGTVTFSMTESLRARGRLEAEVERFIAYHQARDNRYVRWQQAWTTWVTSRFNEGVLGNGNGHSGEQAGNPMVRAALRRAAERNTGGNARS